MGGGKIKRRKGRQTNEITDLSKLGVKQKFNEDAEAKARKEAETKAREEAETKAREEAETKAREEAETKAKKARQEQALSQINSEFSPKSEKLALLERRAEWERRIAAGDKTVPKEMKSYAGQERLRKEANRRIKCYRSTYKTAMRKFGSEDSPEFHNYMHKFERGWGGSYGPPKPYDGPTRFDMYHQPVEIF